MLEIDQVRHFIYCHVHVYMYKSASVSIVWRHLVYDIDLCCSPKSQKKIHKAPYFGVLGHSRSSNSAPIESQCTTSY